MNSTSHRFFHEVDTDVSAFGMSVDLDTLTESRGSTIKLSPRCHVPIGADVASSSFVNVLLQKFQGQKAKFCSVHKWPSMIDVRSRRCAAVDCKRQPSYGFEGSRACFCAAHKTEGMVDVVSRRCERPHCRRRPLYGYEVSTFLAREQSAIGKVPGKNAFIASVPTRRGFVRRQP